jgi:acyl carrier protein
LGQVAAEEYQEMACACVDLDPEASEEQCAADLLSAASVADDESRIAWRDRSGYAARLEPLSAPTAQFAIQSDVTYLITGANGSIARELAFWLVRRGARHLALISRSSADTGVLAILAEQGAHPRFYQADVADRAALASVLDEIARNQRPLAGIFHLAGVLDDGLIAGQDWERWKRVLAPKVSGAWNLHQLTLTCDVPLFVGFSSAASLLGNAGQGSYAAANSFLDALARHRRASGLSGLSVNWGPWGELGMASRLDADQQARIEALGISSIGTRSALDMLGRLLGAGSSAGAGEAAIAQVGVLAISWQRYGRTRANPFLARLAGSSEMADRGARSIREQLRQASPNERKSLVVSALVDLVAEGLHMPRSEVAPRERLFDLGVDSLIAVELKNRLQAVLGLSLSTTLLFDYPTIEALTDYLMDELSPALGADEPAKSVAGAANDGGQQDLNDLSDDEAESLLLEQLEKLEGR